MSMKKSRNVSVTPKSSSRFNKKSVKSFGSGLNRFRSQRDRTRNKSKEYRTSQSGILQAPRGRKTSEGLQLCRSGSRKHIPFSNFRRSSNTFSESSNSIYINKSDMISDNTGNGRININIKPIYDINGRRTNGFGPKSKSKTQI